MPLMIALTNVDVQADVDGRSIRIANFYVILNVNFRLNGCQLKRGDDYNPLTTADA